MRANVFFGDLRRVRALWLCQLARLRGPGDEVAESPTGIIPESLMRPEKKADVIAWLVAGPAEAKWKKKMLLSWAQMVGVRLRKQDYDKVEGSAIDR